jgi:diguanylate cyclase
MAEIVALSAPGHVLRILLVEDSPSDALLIEKVVTRATLGGSRVHHEKTLEAALHSLRQTEYDVVLLDLSLPDSTKLDGLLSIQNFAPKLPVVILTAYADEELALKAVERGAQDYLFKDKLDAPMIRRAMQYAVQRKQFEATLITQANFDPLTGLANRTLFESRLEMALARIRRSSLGLGVFFLDLNRFKQVNDTLGHAAGDKLLAQVAERLRQCLRPYDTAARFGGDEFALLVEGIEQARDCAVIAQKILNRIAEPFPGMSSATVDISIGIATCFAGEKAASKMLMRHADEAMYGAKQSPHSSYRFYTPEIQEEASVRLRLEEELHNALARGELAIHYQPKIDLNTGRTTGAEALIRWNHPVRGLLLPAEFMAVAEETQFAKAIGEWVIATVCEDMARWNARELPSMQVSINISATQLDDSSFADITHAFLRKYQLPPPLLAVEVPASAFLERIQERADMLASFRKLGIGVHLDHFGTCAISLSALKNLSVDAIKIAPELTRTLNEPDGMLSLVRALMDIAQHFKMNVVAGGIENEWQQAFFKEQQCQEGQGYALCRPVPGEYIPDWLSRSNGGHILRNG